MRVSSLQRWEVRHSVWAVMLMCRRHGCWWHRGKFLSCLAFPLSWRPFGTRLAKGNTAEGAGSEGRVRKRYTQKGLLRVCIPSRGPNPSSDHMLGTWIPTNWFETRIVRKKNLILWNAYSYCCISYEIRIAILGHSSGHFYNYIWHFQGWREKYLESYYGGGRNPINFLKTRGGLAVPGWF